jgi:hypothetical protein
MRQALTWAGLALGCATGCLYLGDRNEPPRVRIERRMAGEPAARGVSTTFAARAEDDDGAPDLIWAKGRHCPARLEDAAVVARTETGGGETFTVEPATLDDFCVWVIATDEHGARGWAALPVTVTNRAPTAVLSVAPEDDAVASIAPGAPASTYDMFTEFVLRWAGSSDPEKDPLSPTFSVRDEGGRPVETRACRRETPDPATCFVAERPGPYRVELVLRDGPAGAPKTKESPPATATVRVHDDRPAAIRTSDPPPTVADVVRSPEKLSFLVMAVDDDLDPYPAVGARGPILPPFRWSYRRGTSGPFVHLAPSWEERLAFAPEEFSYGETIQVRVEYQDRAAAKHPPCRDVEAMRCPAARAGGGFRWVTWTVRVQ